MIGAALVALAVVAGLSRMDARAEFTAPEKNLFDSRSDVTLFLNSRES